jgi:HK97 family phage prohead protease
MIIRTKSGEIVSMNNEQLPVGNNVFLDYLGIKRDVTGIQKVTKDVELIVCVPFINEKLVISNEECKDGFMQTSFAWTLSTYDLDRYGERIDPNGWDFRRYMQNPVVEWAHRYDIPAIGKIEGLTIDDDGLHGVVCFNSKEFDPFGWSIGERVKAGVIRAGSVGFRVIEIEIPTKDDSPNGGNDETSLIFRKQELLEFSICNVPANPFALAKMCNEKLEMRNEKSDIASSFWGSFINNLQGV